MPAQSPLPQPDPAEPVQPSRRERRGGRTAQPQTPGITLPGRGAQHIPPARKHSNYRRSWY